jgi:predicted choloylglycine hydrolase
MKKNEILPPLKKVTVGYFELKGTHYEIGHQLGELLGKKRMILNKRVVFTEKELASVLNLFRLYCSGLCEEMQGYADAVGVKIERMLYPFMTYLKPRCSQMVLLPQLTWNGHTILARSYEFTPRLEDFHLFQTEVKGKYTHIGGSVAEFGRSEGVNECGLGVSMTSCGFPVSNLKKMYAPAIYGLQFWAVVRTILENCKDVMEAVEYVKNVPMAYNINLLLADNGGQAALVETLDGKFAMSKIGDHSEKKYLHSTNHAHIEEFITFEPLAMHNSRVRYERIQQFLEIKKKRNEEEVKQFLLTEYPNGLNCHFYQQAFGTIKSVFIDLDDFRFSICWGGLKENGWKDYEIKKAIGNYREKITLLEAETSPEFFILE